ncbi:MAG: hypothetical protein XD94_1440 [Mesotoga prima]|jgi:hypothetical protein|uniref:Uncharacterized protein n=1 Tax=Mesotoga prima TaxID=1184387 RepID=A0A101HLX9_9BACT|nr:MAG: hypothetical protein XD94_1440 [Mesotoga prima]
MSWEIAVIELAGFYGEANGCKNEERRARH